MFASQLLCRLHAGKRIMANGPDLSISIVFTFIANLNFWQPIYCFKKTVRYFLIHCYTNFTIKWTEFSYTGQANRDIFRSEIEVIRIVLYMLFDLSPCESGTPYNLSLDVMIGSMVQILYGSNNNDILWKSESCAIVLRILIFTFNGNPRAQTCSPRHRSSN